jgi:hypothetical protein
MGEFKGLLHRCGDSNFVATEIKHVIILCYTLLYTHPLLKLQLLLMGPHSPE